MEGCGNGDFMDKKYFLCPDGKGHFCHICDLQPLYSPGDALPGQDSANTPTADSHLQQLVQQKKDLVQQSVSQQAKIEQLTKELFLLQQNQKDMETALSERLRSKQHKVSQLHEACINICREASLGSSACSSLDCSCCTTPQLEDEVLLTSSQAFFCLSR